MTPTSRWLRRAGFVLAVVTLHVLAVVPLHDPAQLRDAVLTVSPDLLLLAAVAVIGGAAGRPGLVAHLAAALLLLATFLRVADVVTLTAFGKEFELADFGRVWPIFDAWANKAGAFQRWAWGIGMLLALALLHWLVARAFRVVARTAAQPRGAAAWLVALQALVLAGVLCPHRAFQPSPLRMLVAVSVDALREWLDPGSVLGPVRAEITAAAQRMQRDPHGLERLDGADVHLLVLESYGRVALRHPALAPRLRGFLTRCQQQLAADGLAACSSSCAPAVKGGRSGLAHAELLTGVRVPSERVRSLLMASELVALPRRFQQAGYRTHELLPGMPIHWPEGDAFYGIDASIIQGELGYDGTLYDFGQMPDQFALQKLMERVIEPAEQPVFSMFVGVSSHAPWSAIPHYVDDWQIDARTFAGAPARTHDVHYRTMLRDPAALPAYADALEYVLRTAFDFARRLQRPSVVVVVGDHQPPIAGALAPADPSFDVPIHVVTNRPELLAPLRALGFVDGLDVPDEVRAWPMAEFAPTVLRAWSR